MTDRELAKRLRETGGLDPMMVLQAAEVIERLRELLENSYEFTKTLTAERDEARRLVCRSQFTMTELQHDYAKAKGWDCFEEAP
jgi:hypothetical protein